MPTAVSTEPDTLQSLIPRLRRHGTAAALVAAGDPVRTLTAAELAERIERLAGGLIGDGVTPGEPIAVVATSSPEWMTAALAVIAAGAVAVPIDVRQGRRSLAHMLKDCGCRRLFTTADRVAALRAAMDEAAMPKLWLLDGDDDRPEGPSWHRLLGEPAPLPAVAAEATAAIFYTSGTTGTPKGVPLTHRNLMVNLTAILDEELVSSGDRCLVPLPLHHVYPFMIGMLVPLAAGTTIVLPAGVSGPEILRALREQQVGILVGVPRLYEALAAAIERRLAQRRGLGGWAVRRLVRLSVAIRRRFGWRIGRQLLRPLHQALAPDLRLLVSGGAKLDADLAWLLEGLGFEVLTGYGLTETAPIVAFNNRRHAKLETAGRPLPGVEVRSRPVPGKATGEIQVRGPNVFAGYLHLPDNTAEAFTDDGWFRTGDLGELGADGYLRITSRVNETIVLPGGENVFPEEVEEVFTASPVIRDAAVLEHDGGLVLLVVPNLTQTDDSDPTVLQRRIGEEIRRLSAGLPSYQRVSGFALTRQSLPRTQLGKLRRHELPPLFAAASAEPGAGGPEEPLSEDDRDLLEDPRASRVWEWLHQRFPDKPITPDASPQVDLGIDSLDWVTLTLDLQEELGVRLDERALAEIASVRDLLQQARTAEAADPAEPQALDAAQRRWLAPKGPLLTAVAAVLFAVNWLVMHGVFRLRVVGREHLPRRGGFVLTPNHASFLDPFAVGAALPYATLRRTRWAGLGDILFSTAPRRLFSRAANVFPIDPAAAPVSSLSYGRAVLEGGDVLIWFPEGGRSRDGSLQRFMPGIGRLVAATGATVVPVLVDGTFAAWPPGRRLPRPGAVRVVFGEPLPADRLAAATGEAAEQAAATLRSQVAALAAAGGHRHRIDD